MLTSVKYAYESGVYVWPIPFPFGDANQIGVRLVQADGQEKQLQAGLDYALQDANVVYFLKPGQALILYLDADPVQVLQSNQQKTMTVQTSPAVQIDPAPAVVDPAPARDAQIAAMQAQIDALAAERDRALLAARAAEEDRQLAAIRNAGASAADDIAASANAAAAKIRQAQADAELVASGITDNLNTIIRNANATLQNASAQIADAEASLELNYQEKAGSLDRKASEIEARLNEAGEQAAFAVMSAGQTQVAAYSMQSEAATQAITDCSDHVEQAEAAANMAGSYAAQAQNHAVNAGLAVADCKMLASRTQNWEEQAEEVCKIATSMANNASRNAWAIATQDRRPGIASVQSEEDLAGAGPGCFIINPHIRQSPTIQYGVWPVASLDEAKWDGFFVIGKAFTGLAPNGPVIIPDPVPPGLDPDNPDNPGNSGNSGNGFGGKLDWLPCDHTHQEAANA